MSKGFFEQLHTESKAAGLDFLLVGGNAVNAYGYQRTTLDVDLLISDQSLGAWRSYWESRGYRCVHTTDAFCQFRSADKIERLPVDLMIVDQNTFDKIMHEQNLREVGGIKIKVPDPLHIIALKLHACRNPERARAGKDIQDIIGLIQNCHLDTESVDFKAVLNRYADEKTREEIIRRIRSS